MPKIWEEWRSGQIEATGEILQIMPTILSPIGVDQMGKSPFFFFMILIRGCPQWWVPKNWKDRRSDGTGAAEAGKWGDHFLDHVL